MKTRILLASLICLAASAQTIIRPESDTKRKYEVSCSGTAAAESPSCTVHLPASVTGVRVRFKAIVARSPEATNLVIEWGGGTPSGGTDAVVRGRNTTLASGLTAKVGATSSSPVYTKSYPLTAGYDVALDASDDELPAGAVAGRTLRLTTSSTVTGAYQFVVALWVGL